MRIFHKFTLSVLLLVVVLAPSKSFVYRRKAQPSYWTRTHHRTWATVHPAIIGWASWYGPEMRHKRKKRLEYGRMANGQRFNPSKFTAASRTLPLGTIVRVSNLETGKSVQVTITDRGPFVDGRILDLAEAAAMQIQCPGLCPVTVTPEEPPLTAASTDVRVPVSRKSEESVE